MNQDGSRGPQVHDFNKGIVPFPNGLFWTAKIDPASVSVDPSDLSGGAVMKIEEMHALDFHTFANSFQNGAVSGHEPVNLSWTHRWSGAATPASGSDGKEFAYKGVLDRVSIEWSAKKSDGFRFESDPASTSVSSFALLANERNGRFFK